MIQFCACYEVQIISHMSNFSGTICENHYDFHIELPWHFCYKFIDYTYMWLYF